jgi:hypothetical protein
MSLLRRARHALGRAFGDVLARALNDVPRRTIYDGDGINPYLSRWYLLGRFSMPDGSSPFDRFGNPKPGASSGDSPIGLYIHRFHRSDIDRELHGHPWTWALSFVVAGGYREERRVGRSVWSRIVPPLSLNFLTQEDYHRVDLLEADAWTIFLVGPKASSWGFWDRETGELTPWREFFNRKQRGPS